MHEIPCEDCGSVNWLEWQLLPHKVFNSVCPGGNGYLCFPCFAERAVRVLRGAKPQLPTKSKGSK